MERTSYYEAINCFGNHYVLCNEIPNIDSSIWDNFYNYPDEDEEIFQFFLSDCSDADVKYLTSMYSRVYFTYSEKLDLWVLCVTHYGTSWHGVMVDVMKNN